MSYSNNYLKIFLLIAILFFCIVPQRASAQFKWSLGFHKDSVICSELKPGDQRWTTLRWNINYSANGPTVGSRYMKNSKPGAAMWAWCDSAWKYVLEGDEAINKEGFLDKARRNCDDKTLTLSDFKYYNALVDNSTEGKYLIARSSTLRADDLFYPNYANSALGIFGQIPQPGARYENLPHPVYRLSVLYSCPTRKLKVKDNALSANDSENLNQDMTIFKEPNAEFLTPLDLDTEIYSPELLSVFK